MANLTKKPNTIKSIGKKVADNGNASDYVYVPIGADSDNVDRPDGSTVEESLSNIEVEKVEIIPVEILPTSNIKEYPFIYALVKANETKGILYEYRDGEWIPYGNGSNGIWVGTKEECAKDFNNIENGTFVIIINKNEGTGETHTHDYVCFVTKEPTYSQTGTKTCTCFLCGESYTEEIPALVDSINPAGVIRIGTNEYATWKDVVEFNKYYKENQTVTIEATDNETGIKEIAYYLATAAINTSDIASINWTVYNDAFEIAPNNNYIIYARITDNADNVTYICSDGIVMDNIPPVFEGLENGGTYPTGTVLTVEEGATLTIDGVVVELVNNTYTFTEPKDNIQVSLTDRAGNESNISIIIEHAHNYINGICSICGKNEYIDFKLSKNNYQQAGILSLNGDINIPETFEYNNQKYKLVEIEDLGFATCLEITSINIPDSVTKIGYKAFYNCKNLNTIIMKDGIEYIGEEAFCYCENLTNLSMPNSISEIGKNAFKGCSKLESVKISCNLVKLEDRIFSKCTNLSSIEIPNNIKTIGIAAFEDCSNLSSLIINDGVNIICDGAFYRCEKLTSVTIPNSVSSIGAQSFTKVPHIYYNGTAIGSPWGALAIN